VQQNVVQQTVAQQTLWPELFYKLLRARIVVQQNVVQQNVVQQTVVQQNVVQQTVVQQTVVVGPSYGGTKLGLFTSPLQEVASRAHISKRDQFWDQFRGVSSWVSLSMRDVDGLARLQGQHLDLGFEAGGYGREVGGAGVGGSSRWRIWVHRWV